jgi:DNA invertase Pin-like site-specific DNA recombinase
MAIDSEWGTRLGRVGHRLAVARDKEAAVRKEAREAAIAAVKAGQSEAGVAKALGVDRMAVRKWLGKGRKPDDHG